MFYLRNIQKKNKRLQMPMILLIATSYWITHCTVAPKHDHSFRGFVILPTCVLKCALRLGDDVSAQNAT